VELVVEDMRDIDESHMEGCSSVINIGGLSNDPTAEFNPQANEELNAPASIRLAEIAKRAGVKRLVLASTASIYDRGVADETRDVVKDEEAQVDPKAAYATSKLAAERAILEMADASFAPVVFRKGTIFGFSPRMRYDLVVNAFVKDALATGLLNVFMGGEMWRPLVDVEDVARAYVIALDAETDRVGGQVFNLSAGNFRIAELALRTKRALGAAGVSADVNVDYENRLVRSYRIATTKAERVLGFSPRVTVEESVARMVREIRALGLTDFSHARYYNIEWMKVLEEATGIVRDHGYVLSRPPGAGEEGPRVSRIADRARRSG